MTELFENVEYMDSRGLVVSGTMFHTHLSRYHIFISECYQLYKDRNGYQSK